MLADFLLPCFAMSCVQSKGRFFSFDKIVANIKVTKVPERSLGNIFRHFLRGTVAHVVIFGRREVLEHFATSFGGKVTLVGAVEITSLRG